MPTAGEIQGTYTVVTNSSGEVVGGGELTHTFGGALIETSNKSNGDNVTYLDGELSAKQHIWSGPFTYNNDTQFRKVRKDSLSGTQDTYTLTYVGSGAVTDESFSGKFAPTGFSDSIPHGAKVEMSMSFNSSGEVTHIEATDV
tara:strand:+ start:218 stop:646 length:429 start_codon:yes stop_codon:yes gene_type:complete